MRTFIKSPMYHNLNAEQFQAFIEWLTTDPVKSEIYPGKWIVPDGRGPAFLDIHELLEYWYYEIKDPTI